MTLHANIGFNFFQVARTMPGSTDSLFESVSALCSEDWRASIGVAVHRFGKCAKVFSVVMPARIFGFCRRAEKPQGYEDFARRYRIRKKAPPTFAAGGAENCYE
jgi:hypothetical protein